MIHNTLEQYTLIGCPYHNGIDYTQETYCKKQEKMKERMKMKYSHQYFELYLNLVVDENNHTILYEEEYVNGLHNISESLRNVLNNTPKNRILICVICKVCNNEQKILIHHAKCLIYNKKNKTFYFIDSCYIPNQPFRYDENINHFIENILYCTKNPRFSYEQLQNRKNVKRNIKLKQSQDLYKMNLGLQTKETAIPSQEMGFCLPWTFLIGEIVLSNPEIDIESIFDILCHYSAIELKKMIRGYITCWWIENRKSSLLNRRNKFPA